MILEYSGENFGGAFVGRRLTGGNRHCAIYWHKTGVGQECGAGRLQRRRCGQRYQLQGFTARIGGFRQSFDGLAQGEKVPDLGGR